MLPGYGAADRDIELQRYAEPAAALFSTHAPLFRVTLASDLHVAVGTPAVGFVNKPPAGPDGVQVNRVTRRSGRENCRRTTVPASGDDGRGLRSKPLQVVVADVPTTQSECCTIEEGPRLSFWKPLFSQSLISLEFCSSASR
jgi:hypothetical protein